MPELQSHRESSTLPAHPVPIEGDHLFQAIPTTSSDGSEKVAAFRPEWVAAFRRNQWSPSRRNRWPLSPGKRIANDLGFHLKLYRAALKESWCQRSSGSEWDPGRFFHLGLETAGFETALHCRVDHETFAQFLKNQTAAHLPPEQETTDHGTPYLHRPRRVLPDSLHAPAQLGLFGELRGPEEAPRPGRSVRR